MSLTIEDRASESPLVERIWRSQSTRVDTFVSVAVSQLDLVFWKQEGKTYLSLQGPETSATRAPVPEDAEFFGIFFKVGVYMPHLPVERLVNSFVPLPKASSRSFWLNSSAWEIPTFENADHFVAQLVRAGLLVRDPAVHEVMQGGQPAFSPRSIQRRFLGATGLTYSTIQQIERARYAHFLLKQERTILDTVEEAGYYDQAHLTRAMKRFIGQTPVQLQDKHSSVDFSVVSQPAPLMTPTPPQVSSPRYFLPQTFDFSSIHSRNGSKRTQNLVSLMDNG